MPDKKSGRGFASLNADERRAVASKGGRSVPGEKRTFAKDRELAVEAGRKSGISRGRKP